MNPVRIIAVALLAGSLSIGIAVLGERWLSARDAIPAWMGQRALLGEGAVRDPDGLLSGLPDLALPDLDGTVVSHRDWSGQVVLIHYWATWCPGCLRELPRLAQVQREADTDRLQVIGIAIDDPAEVARFLADNPVDYPILIGGLDAIEQARALGNRTDTLPFTVIFDARGHRIFNQQGELSAARLQEQLAALLEPRATNH
ncbi:MAG: TlpA family protein disulfide reductase [Chromatiaceae bacterium]|nr:MAG: TlpA family protein disulfide reductase [Chromatiaceae bacterium]